MFGGNEEVIDFYNNKICLQEDAIVLGIIIIIIIMVSEIISEQIGMHYYNTGAVTTHFRNGF